MFCGEQTILATSHFGQVAAPVKCKRWGCPNCQEWRQKCLQARGIEGKPNRFILFTCRRGQFATPILAAQAMVAAWRTIVQRWRRLEPWHKCEYLAVFEPHESGWPHMHILWNGHWLDQKWLSKQASEILNSPVVSVLRIKDGKSAVFYVTKYFSKEPTKFGTCKRYWTSKNWPKLAHIDADKAFHNGFPTELVNKRIDDVIAAWKHGGKTIWYKAPDVAGWGALWEPEGVPNIKHPPTWNYYFGFPTSSAHRRKRLVEQIGTGHG